MQRCAAPTGRGPWHHTAEARELGQRSPGGQVPLRGASGDALQQPCEKKRHGGVARPLGLDQCAHADGMIHWERGGQRLPERLLPWLAWHGSHGGAAPCVIGLRPGAARGQVALVAVPTPRGRTPAIGHVWCLLAEQSPAQGNGQQRDEQRSEGAVSLGHGARRCDQVPECSANCLEPSA